MNVFFRKRGLLAFVVLMSGLSATAQAQTGNQVIYTDSLQNGWQNWSWATVNLSAVSPSPVHLGTDSISVSCGGFQALYLHHDAFNASFYSGITFWINGNGGGASQLLVQGTLNGVAQSPGFSLSVPTGTGWVQVTAPFSALGVSGASDMDGFWIQSQSSSTIPTFYVDDITMLSNSAPPPTITLTSPTNGASFAAPANINFSATIVTNNEQINKVQFFNGSTLLGTATNAPYNFTWQGVSAGLYTVSSKVTYNTNQTIASGTADITVKGMLQFALGVDAQKNQHAISPMIYGTAFAKSNELSDLNFVMNRSGGNNETRYNWLVNAHNLDNDWFFESLDDGNSTPGATADQFVADSKNGGAQPMITIPMLGWVAKLGPARGRLSSYNTNLYGEQESTDQFFATAGNGVSYPSGKLIITNLPTDANTNVNAAFQKGYVQHLMSTWGASTNGGVKFYLMDNEHSLWSSTHRDVHPVGPTMQEIYNDITNYATMVKSTDSNTLVCGPEEWGWPGYFYSGYDQQWSGSNNDFNTADYPDRGSNGSMDYMPWLLSHLHQHDTATGTRLLDYFTLHCYPQEGNVGGQTNVDEATQLLRNESTRQFWDTTYVDPSWINSIIMLIPRMKQWVTNYYPGTKIGVTEYNWGAETNIGGATAQADLLGIFGREGLDLATRWTTPAPSSPTYLSMKMYRNYDGKKSTFGDTSILATSTNVDDVAVFGALRSSDGAMTLMVVNKQIPFAAGLNLGITNFNAAGTAHVWQLTSANVISNLPDVSLSGGMLSTTVPAQSVTLFVIPVGSSGAPQIKSPSVSAGNNLSFLVNGSAGQQFVLQSSSDLFNWLPMSTNTLPTTQMNLSVPISTSGAKFFRAKKFP